MSKSKTSTVTRRSFIKTGIIAGVSGHALGNWENSSAQVAQADPYLGYVMGVASYGFRYFTTEEAVAMVRGLGLSSMSMWPDFARSLGGGKTQKDIELFEKNPKRWASIKTVLDKYNVTCSEYGVSRFGPDINENRKTFEFCKQNGIKTIAGYPSADAFDNLDKLVEEYKITIGIHNHGKEDKLYGKISQVEAAIKNHSPLIGACVDVGHFVKAGDDPVAAIKTFGKRIYGAHLKDLDKKGEQAIVGEGTLDTPGILAALQEAGFEGAFNLEYEANPEAVLPPIVASLENIKKLLAKTKRAQSRK